MLSTHPGRGGWYQLLLPNFCFALHAHKQIGCNLKGRKLAYDRGETRQGLNSFPAALAMKVARGMAPPSRVPILITCMDSHSRVPQEDIRQTGGIMATERGCTVPSIQDFSTSTGLQEGAL